MKEYDYETQRLYSNEISYLKSHPTATLEDYVNYLNEIQIKIKEENKDKIENYYNWFKEREGKYFFINFNNESFSAFQFRMPDPKSIYLCELIKCKRYDIYNKNGEYQINEAKLGKINKLWMHNPYETINYSYGDIVSCEEITKEQFDKIENFVKNTMNPFIDNIIRELK